MRECQRESSIVTFGIIHDDMNYFLTSNKEMMHVLVCLIMNMIIIKAV